MEAINTDTSQRNKIKRAEAFRLLFKSSLKDPSLCSLLVSNLAVIYLAIVQNWSLGSVLFVYWQQSVIIGFFTFIKILQLKNYSTKDFKNNGKPALPTRAIKINAAFFFLFHFGFFHAGYLLFVLSLAEPGVISKEIASLLSGGAIFFMNHLFSYLYNKPWAVEGQEIGAVMGLPYVRIIPMHLIIFLAFPAQIFFGLAGVKAIFLLLKTFADALMHISEHTKDYESAFRNSIRSYGN